MQKFPRIIPTGNIAQAYEYVGYAKKLLHSIRLNKLPFDVRVARPVPGILIKVTGGTAAQEIIKIDAAGLDWITQILDHDGQSFPNYPTKPLVGSNYVQQPWRAIVDSPAVSFEPRVYSCGKGWAYILVFDELIGATEARYKIRLYYKGFPMKESPTYPEFLIAANYTFIGYRLPIFCGFVQTPNGIKRRFVVQQIQDLNNPADPPGPEVIEDGEGFGFDRRMRYLSWIEDDSTWQVILPPDPRVHDPAEVFRYGPVAYLGNDTLIAWSLYDRDDAPNPNQFEFNAWKSTDFGSSWSSIGGTSVIENNYNLGTVTRLQSVGTRCYAFGNGAVAWQISRDRPTITVPFPTVTFYSLDGTTIVEGAESIEEELFDSENYTPIVISPGVAIALTIKEGTTPTEAKWRLTTDYGATWNDAGDFPVNQHLGLDSGHDIRSWMWYYIPTVLRGILYIPLQKPDGSIGIYSSEDNGFTWLDTGGVISTTSRRWFEDLTSNGSTTPKSILYVDELSNSNDAIPEIDGVINGSP